MESPYIKREDTEVFDVVFGEEKREREGLELIPSENYVSNAVREAMASVLTNKYAEGYPGARYYGGQEFTDAIETLAIERAKKLFDAAHANVQPLGGANANIATYMALLAPGDTVLGMELTHGGHLTHGHPVTYLSRIFNFVRYGMKDIETGELDYDHLLAVAKKERPKVILAGFSAYPREPDWQRIAAIAKEVEAYAVADVAHIAGLIAGGAARNPLAEGFDILTMTTHKTLRGPRGGMIVVRDDERLAKNIDQAVFPGLQGGPHMHQIAAKAVCFHEALEPSFKTYAAQITHNAQAMASVWQDRGARLITGGTENHLLLADVLHTFGISGGEAEALLERAGMTVNKNLIPDDTRSPRDPSGIRFGTPAMTTRGFTEEASREVASLMLDVLEKKDETTVAEACTRVIELARAHPIPESFA